MTVTPKTMTLHLKTLMLAGTAVLATACAPREMPEMQVSAHPPQWVRTGDMTEAAFRYLFVNNASAFKHNVAAYCVGLGQGQTLRDPEPRMVMALNVKDADPRPVVLPASGCVQGVDVKDRATGGRAILFRVSDVQCQGDSCTFQGGYYEGNVSASNGMFRATRHGDSWQIMPAGPQVIS